LKNYDNDWKNCVENGLTLSDHGCFGFMRNLGDSSSQDCTFERRDCYWVLKRSHSLARDIFVKHKKLGTPQTHDSLFDSKYIPELKIYLS